MLKMCGGGSAHFRATAFCADPQKSKIGSTYKGHSNALVCSFNRSISPIQLNHENKLSANDTLTLRPHNERLPGEVLEHTFGNLAYIDISRCARVFRSC